MLGRYRNTDEFNRYVFDYLLLSVVKHFGYSWQEVLALTPEELALHLSFIEAEAEAEKAQRTRTPKMVK